MKYLHIIVSIGLTGIISLSSCQQKKSEPEVRTYSKADSLTEIYLDLQDSILFSWNQMMNDDNIKIKSMRHLLYELQVVGQVDPEQLHSLEVRINKLKSIRYTAKTMVNTDLVDEYDFASNSLVTELITLAESHSAYAYNITLQTMVERIRTAEQRIENYRLTYDVIVTDYNQFLSVNKDVLLANGQNTSLDKKPLFHMVAE
jgi:hypothetical protein